MPGIGKNHPLVTLIHQKTKIKKQDIVDMLKVMPECMVEAFITENLEANKPMDMGGVSLRWKTGGIWGPFLQFKATPALKSHFTRFRIEKKYPLAVKLFDLMHPKSKERALQARSKA